MWDPDSGLTYEEIAEKYECRLLELVRRHVPDVEAAGRIIRATLDTAREEFSARPMECAAYTWLCQIALHHCKQHFRETWRTAGRTL